MKYFPTLKHHLTTSACDENTTKNKAENLQKYNGIIKDIKYLFCERFANFQKMDSTLQFIISPHTIKFEDIETTFFSWLNIDHLEVELMEFQNSTIWKNKFLELTSALEKKISCCDNAEEAPEEKIENIILKVWNAIPNTFSSMKNVATALLTIFGSTYNCEQLFSAMNFIKSNIRNRLGNDLSAASVMLKLSKYEPRINVLASKRQQQISH